MMEPSNHLWQLLIFIFLFAILPPLIVFIMWVFRNRETIHDGGNSIFLRTPNRKR